MESEIRESIEAANHLRLALRLLPGHWTQGEGHLAGLEIRWRHYLPYVALRRRYTLLSALWAVQAGAAVLAVLQRSLSAESLSTWNDRPGRTEEAVIEALTRLCADLDENARIRWSRRDRPTPLRPLASTDSPLPVSGGRVATWL